MKTYQDLARDVLSQGEEREDRTGTGTIGIFGAYLKVNLNDGFPLLTTKKCHLKSIIHELLWFLSGDTNIKYLKDNNVTIWDEWANDNGSVGPMYGAMWRKWPSNELLSQDIDQISNLVDQIKENPYSRRHVVSAWNPQYLPNPRLSPQVNASYGHMSLAPCHGTFQVYISNDGYLSLQMYQRSADLFLGVPYNIASYALLTMMLAQVTGCKPGSLTMLFGDLHIYKNHLSQIRKQLLRPPRQLPVMTLNSNVTNIFKFKYSDFTLTNYDPWPAIKGEVSI